MILVNANLLIYAPVSTFSQHKKAREWLDTQLNDGISADSLDCVGRTH